MLNQPPAPGTQPRFAAPGEQEASRWVREMFGRVAPRYDLLNRVLSFRLDTRWRKKTVERVAPLLRPGARVLDLCCGTGDLLLALEERAGAPLLGSDFCHPMLVEANRKVAARRLRSPLFEGDAMQLPLRDESLDLITVAFGFRNLANYENGLIELRRALKPGGCLAILEFSQPTNPAFAALYGFFSTQVLPRVGGLVSGASDAYTYLPESIRKFPNAQGLADKARRAGFARVEFDLMTGGAVALHLCFK